MRISTKSNPSHDEVRLDLTKEELERRFLVPYREGRPIVIGGKTVQPNDLERIRISYTDQNSRELLPAIRTEREASSVVAIGISDEWEVAYRGKDVTDELIVGPQGFSSTGQLTVSETIRRLSTAVVDLRKQCNESARFQGVEPIFKATTNTELIAAELPSYLSQNERDFKEFVDKLYRFLIESAGKRVTQPTPKWEEAIDAIKRLRDYFFHDLEHGDESDVGKKYKHVGTIYENLINKKLPEQDDWVKLQVAFLRLVSNGLESIREEVSKGSTTPKTKTTGPKTIRTHSAVSTTAQTEQWTSEERHFSAFVAYYVVSMFGVFWGLWWIVNPTGAFGLAVLTTLVVGTVTYGIAHWASWETRWIIRKAKDWFPVVACGTCCFVAISVATQYSILNYPSKTELAFSTHLLDSPGMSLIALGFVLMGGFILELPAIADSHKGKTLTCTFLRWVRLNRRVFTAAFVLTVLFGILFANVATIDSNLVLFTPKIAFVETRYLSDGFGYHVYQIGLTTFGAWSQNEQIVHVLTPAYPLITDSSYSFLANSTTHAPSIESSSNLTVSTPIQDSEGNIVVYVTTDSTSTMGQFSVQFYSEYDDLTPIAYVNLSPPIDLTYFSKNQTQRVEERFVVVNHSPYALVFESINVYVDGSAPVNETFSYYPQAYPTPYCNYDNVTRTFSINGGLQAYGNLTLVVIFDRS